MKAPTMICTQCGSIDGAKSTNKGSILAELVLWCMFIVPGLIYSIWRLSTRSTGCKSCGSSQLVKTASPVGAELMRRFHPEVLNGAVSRNDDVKTAHGKAILISVVVGFLLLRFGQSFTHSDVPRASVQAPPPVARPVAETHVSRQAQETGISDQKLPGINLAFKAQGVSDAQRDEAIKNLNLSISEAAADR